MRTTPHGSETIQPAAPSLRSQAFLLVALVAVFGGFLFGYDTAVINGANQYLKAHFNLNSIQEGIAGASAILGCIPGAMFAGFLSDRLADAEFFSFVPYCTLFQDCCPPFRRPSLSSWSHGLSAGSESGFLHDLPRVHSRDVPESLARQFGSMFQLGIVTGIFLTLFINALSKALGTSPETTTGWRWMLGAEVVPAISCCSCSSSSRKVPVG